MTFEEQWLIILARNIKVESENFEINIKLKSTVRLRLYSSARHFFMIDFSTKTLIENKI